MRPRKLSDTERGGTLVQVILALIVMFGFVALTIDYGSMVVRQRQLQTATDAGAWAAGPLLAWMSNGSSTAPGSAQVMAKDYAVFNGADPAKVEAIADTAENTLTVTAQEDVNTSFMNVLSGTPTRGVSAMTRIKISPNVDPGWLAPLAIQFSYLKDDMDHLWGKPAELLMDMVNMGTEKNPRWDFPSDPGTPWNGSMSVLQGNIVAIDLHSTAKTNYLQAVAEYQQFLEGDLTGGLSYSEVGNGTWISSLRFQDPVQWTTITAAAFQNIVAGAADLTYQDYTNFTWENPRFVVMLVINRTTGSENKQYDCQFVGYVGFFIEDVTFDVVSGQWLIKGRFVEYSGPEPSEPGGLPPSGSLYGLYTYFLVD